LDGVLQSLEDEMMAQGSMESPVTVNVLGPNSIYAIMDGNYTVNGVSNSAVIPIKALAGDVLTFSITTLSQNQNASVYLYAANHKMRNGHLPLFFFESQKNNYFPPSKDSFAPPKAYMNTFSCAKTFVTRAISEGMQTLSFAVVDNSNGKVLGYFKWEFVIRNSSLQN
jgi:hypothetical protein